MNIASVLCLFVVLSVLAGCQSTEHVWVKDGASQQDFNMDAGECKTQAFGTPEVSPIYSSCMSGKGWYSVDKPTQSDQPESLRPSDQSRNMYGSPRR
jgi:hypothetical protein